ncbi:MAG: metallophosphoesterase [Kiritimatiellaeota bacterium]|nr:metallophosphoesterase [Kiritimatiellota bacterium]
MNSMRNSTHQVTSFHSIVAIGLLTFCLPLLGASRDLTFFLVSDTHVGMQYKDTKPPLTMAEYDQHINDALNIIATIPGKVWPKSVSAVAKDLGPVCSPSGLIIAGDLTDGGKPAQWTDFDKLFPWQGLAPKRFPVFAGVGNHDGGTQAGSVRNKLRERNRAMLKAGMLAALSDDGLHTAWVWQGVHFINLNLYGGDEIKADSKPGAMWDPEKSLTFLKNYLAKSAPAPTPVVIIQHFGFEETTWWTVGMRKALYEAIKNYNIVALLHGHTHGLTHLQFPNDAEYKTYGAGGPRFDCVSAGAFKHEQKKDQPVTGWRHPCECYVFHLSDKQFVAAHYTGGKTGWNTGKGSAELTVVKELHIQK